MPARSDVATDNPVPAPPFWGDRIVKGIPLADYAAYLDERATFMGQWGLKAVPGRRADRTRSWSRPRAGRGCGCGWTGSRPRAWSRRPWSYGYFPCVSEGDDLVVLDESGAERERFSFPRQRRDRHLCLADFFRPRESGETDVVAFQLVTVGSRISEATAELFAKNAYRDYLELHGLSVQLAEALAEYWHTRVRAELGFGGDDPDDLDDFFRLGYRGARYSFGYPACPDLEDRAKVMRLLAAGADRGALSEEFQLAPEQSTDALIVHHPEAKYFSV